MSIPLQCPNHVKKTLRPHLYTSSTKSYTSQSIPRTVQNTLNGPRDCMNRTRSYHTIFSYSLNCTTLIVWPFLDHNTSRFKLTLNFKTIEKRTMEVVITLPGLIVILNYQFNSSLINHLSASTTTHRRTSLQKTVHCCTPFAVPSSCDNTVYIRLM